MLPCLLTTPLQSLNADHRQVVDSTVTTAGHLTQRHCTSTSDAYDDDDQIMSMAATATATTSTGGVAQSQRVRYELTSVQADNDDMDMDIEAPTDIPPLPPAPVSYFLMSTLTNHIRTGILFFCSHHKPGRTIIFHFWRITLLVKLIHRWPRGST